MANTRHIDAYNAGMSLALRTYGLHKQAGWADNLKQMAWGVGPTEALRQYQKGTLTRPGGALHQWWKPQNKLDLAFNYALPAYGMYKALKNKEDPNRVGTAIGLGGSTLGMMLGSRLWGIPGSLIGGTLGQHAGNLAGKLLQPLTAPRAQLPDPMFQGQYGQ